MNQVKTLQNNQDSQNIIVLMTYTTIAGVVLTAIPAIVFSIQFVQSDLWQWLGLAIMAAIMTLSSLNAWDINRSGKPAMAGNWLILGIIIPAASMNFFASGVTLGFIFNAFLIPITILILLYQTKKLGLAVLIGVVVSLYILAIDRWVTFPRLTTEQVFTLTLQVWLNTALFGVVSLYFAFRAFITQSIRVKLIVAFLTVAIISAGTVTVVSNRTTNNALETQAGTNLQSLADTQALVIGDMLNQQIGLLQTLALNHLLVSKLVNIYAEGEDLTELEAQIQELDQQWSIVPDDDSLIWQYLTNATAMEFNHFRTEFPAHVEVFVTDRYGALMATTNRTSDYYQADEEWWQVAFNNGQGAVYIGQPEFDDSSQTFAINIALPVYESDTKTVIGVLRTSYSVQTLRELIASAELGGTGHSDLIFSGGQVLPEYGDSLTPLDDETITQLQASAGEVYAKFDFEGVPSVVSQSPVRTVAGEPAIADLGWTLLAHQDQQQALAPVETQTRASLVLVLVIVGLTAVGAIGMAQLLAGPIARLTTMATQVASGDLNVQAPVESSDEIGKLATTFNVMTDQLHETVATLEDRVTDRTRQLEAVVKVSHRLTGILDLSDLLRQVVILTKETFDYYHVHIYLLEGETLIMAEGYGEAGIEMKRQGHSISLSAPQSLVARAVRAGQIITVENVRNDPKWLPNPLLPDTHSEMAVPVMLGSEAVGALDVQSEKTGGLTQEDEATLSVLANQIAIALRNARAFAQTQTALYEAQRLQRLYADRAWERFGITHLTTDYEFRQPDLMPLDQITTPEATAALEQRQTIDLRLSRVGNGNAAGEKKSDQERITSQSLMKAEHTSLATPLNLGSEIIGVLGIRDENPDRRWTEDEITLIEAVGEQMSLAIENARLFSETQLRARREALTRQIADKIRNADGIEEILQTAVTELSKALEVSQTFIDLDTTVKRET